MIGRNIISSREKSIRPRAREYHRGHGTWCKDQGAESFFCVHFGAIMGRTRRVGELLTQQLGRLIF